MALVVDWYSLSLANVLFAWRRDTGLTSTFARVCVLLFSMSFYFSVRVMPFFVHFSFNLFLLLLHFYVHSCSLRRR